MNTDLRAQPPGHTKAGSEVPGGGELITGLVKHNCTSFPHLSFPEEARNSPELPGELSCTHSSIRHFAALTHGYTPVLH